MSPSATRGAVGWGAAWNVSAQGSHLSARGTASLTAVGRRGPGRVSAARGGGEAVGWMTGGCGTTARALKLRGGASATPSPRPRCLSRVHPTAWRTAPHPLTPARALTEVALSTAGDTEEQSLGPTEDRSHQVRHGRGARRRAEGGPVFFHVVFPFLCTPNKKHVQPHFQRWGGCISSERMDLKRQPVHAGPRRPQFPWKQRILPLTC